jgi:undecaprenyl-diphosphatase
MKRRLRAVWDRLGQIELRILILLLIVVGGTWCFIELADEVLEGETQRFDERVIRAFRRPDDPSMPIGPPLLAESARDVTALGGVAVLVLLIAVVSIFLAMERKFRAVVLVLVASIGGLLLSTLLKHVVQRERPSVVPHLSIVMTSSFPSGHSILAAVVYLTLGVLVARTVERRSARVFCVVVAFFIAILVGLSRIFLGVHYPTDVLAGWMAGLVWSVLCLLVATWLQRRGFVEQPGETGANPE